MGNCLICRIKLTKSKYNTHSIQTIASPFVNNKSEGDNSLNLYVKEKITKTRNDSSKEILLRNNLTSELSCHKKLNRMNNNSNEKMIIRTDRNNNRKSYGSSKYMEYITDDTLTSSQLKKLSANGSGNTSLIGRHCKRNRHVFCDSSMDTETNSTDSTHVDSNYKAPQSNQIKEPVHLFHISRIPPPSPIPQRRKLEIFNTPKTCCNKKKEEKPEIEYTFYVNDKEICRRPILDKRIHSIVANSNCSLKIHGDVINENITNLQCKRIFYRGNPVIPITLKSDNMTLLRKCICRLDTNFPYFNVKAFLNS